MHIESLYRITERDRAPWDAETLLMMAIARQNMADRAVKADCEQPYIEFAPDDVLEQKNETVVSSFFDRFRE